MVVGTTSNLNAIEDLELEQVFDAVLQAPMLTPSEAALVIEAAGSMSGEDARKSSESAFAGRRGVPVREVLTILELAKDAGENGGGVASAQAFAECAKLVRHK